MDAITAELQYREDTPYDPEEARRRQTNWYQSESSSNWTRAHGSSPYVREGQAPGNWKQESPSYWRPKASSSFSSQHPKEGGDAS